MEVQVFGTRNDAATRKALRFFSERRVRSHFVDLDKRAASKGELRRFAERFGVERILDRDGRRFKSLGLAHAHLTEARWLEKLAEEPLLLRTPLVRYGNHVTVGAAEDTWLGWLTKG
jgi:arsenate reductase-like glutaredoxin family protein